MFECVFSFFCKGLERVYGFLNMFWIIFLGLLCFFGMFLVTFLGFWNGFGNNFFSGVADFFEKIFLTSNCFMVSFLVIRFS